MTFMAGISNEKKDCKRKVRTTAGEIPTHYYRKVLSLCGRMFFLESSFSSVRQKAKILVMFTMTW